MTPLVLALLGYLALQLAIGAVVSRRIRTEDDYLVAGRRLGYPLATFSIFATWFGAETCIGAAGRSYAGGLSLASPEPFGYGLCLLGMGIFFARPLWRRRLTTLADLFRSRYSASVERVAAVVLVPGSVLWAAAQIRGFGHVLSSITTLDPSLAVTVAAGFCVLYTVFGGLLADAITDLLQGVVLVLGLVALFALGAWNLGGLGALAAAAARAAPAAARDVPLLESLEAWAIPVCGSMVATELVARVIGCRSGEVARNSSLLAGGLYLAVGVLPAILGAAAASALPGLGDPEQVLPAAAQAWMPGAAHAVFSAALVSAILSTVDSTLLTAAGLAAHNLVVPALGLRTDRARVVVARAGVAAFGAAAWILALRAEGVYALVEQASSLGGAGGLVTVSFGLFTRLGGSWAALASLVGSTATYLAASYAGLPYPFLASLAAALLAYLAGAAAEGLARARAPAG